MSAASSLMKFQTDLRRLPRVIGEKVAAAAAPVLTQLVQATFAAGENPYGNAWAPGSEGQRVTLRGKTGKLEKDTKYVAIGRKIRLKLAAYYAKYQVGKRPIAPSQGGGLPVAYSRALERVAVATIKQELR